jgi:threonine synthase
MDTGGKIATGVLVPLGVIGLAVAGYYGFKRYKKHQHNRITKRLKLKKEDEFKEDIEMKRMGISQLLPDMDSDNDEEYNKVRIGGKRRKTRHRR